MQSAETIDADALDPGAIRQAFEHQGHSPPRVRQRRSRSFFLARALYLSRALGLLLPPLAIAMGLILAVASPGADVELRRAALIATVGAGVAIVLGLMTADQRGGPGSALALSLVIRVATAGMLFLAVDAMCPDSYAYDREARRLLLFGGDEADSILSVVGTHAVPYVYYGLYAVFGPSMVGGFVASAFVASIGAWGFCRGAELGLRGWDVRAYWLAILFLPSLLIWPSILGKDSLVFAALGIVVYGAGGLSVGGQVRHAGAFLGGLLVVGLIRPHIAAVVVLAWFGAQLASRPRRITSRAGGATRAFVLLLGGVAVLALLSSVLGGLRPDTALEVLSRFSTRTSYGGSAITPVLEEGATASEAIPGIFEGSLTVLLRPYLWEAHKPAALFAAVETAGVLLLLIVRMRSCWSALSSGGLFPRFCFLGGLMAMLIIGVAGNLGIIVRHRAMVWPFLLLPFLVSAPVERPTLRAPLADAGDAGDD